MPTTHQRLTPNRARIAEAILYLVARADAKKSILTQYDIVKALFVADTGHLRTHGRPITYDNYVAMKDGPVASEAYNMLKPDYGHAKNFDQWPLWECRPYKGKANMYYNPVRAPDLSKLSLSDQQELDKAQDIVWSLGFAPTRDMTHKHPAYVDAWREKGGRKQYPMNYLLVVEGDKAVFEDVIFASRNS